MKKISVLIIFTLLYVRCASPGNPTGGPKDETPPKLILSTPNNEAVNFKNDEIVMVFDEYIKLKEPQKNIMISPPITPQPTISPMGIASKKITIKFKNDLEKNTTYLINFGESIVDNNEGNKYGDLQFVFSTGTQIDSLALAGKVSWLHFDKKPKRTIIALYPKQAFSDSVVFRKKPYYVATVKEDGRFDLSHLKAGKYYIIGLVDENGDYKYSPNKEAIGFLKNAISIPKDSIINLQIFKEIEKFKFDDIKQISKNHIKITYKGKPDSIVVSAIAKLDKKLGFSQHGVYHFWYKTNKDSIRLRLKLDQYKKTFSRKRKDKVDSLMLTFNRKGKMDLADTLKINANIPLMQVDDAKIIVYVKDSIPVKHTSKIDLSKNCALFFKKEYGASYKVVLLPKSVTDFLGNKNKDTLTTQFKIPKKDSYGTLNISLIGITTPYFIELLNVQNKVVTKSKTVTNKQVSFVDLQPRKYTIRVVFDNNKNNRWDTGIYLQHKQPEKTIDFTKPIEIRANWDINQSYEIK